MDIRDDTEANVPEIQSIYAHHVLHGHRHVRGAAAVEKCQPKV